MINFLNPKAIPSCPMQPINIKVRVGFGKPINSFFFLKTNFLICLNNKYFSFSFFQRDVCLFKPFIAVGRLIDWNCFLKEIDLEEELKNESK
jgi:hypothetical protein